MIRWHDKDPAATWDYLWEPPLDPDDKLASASVRRTSGDIVIESQTLTDTGLIVSLSGGSIGTNSFEGVWKSIGGRGDDEVIVIDVREKLDSPLLDTFRIRYPAFAAVDPASIIYWLTDADRVVGAWGDDRDIGLMAYAARAMIATKTPGIIAPDASGLGGSGVTSFKSGTFSASITDDAANGKLAGLWDDDWASLSRLYGAGLGIASAGCSPAMWGYGDYLLVRG